MPFSGQNADKEGAASRGERVEERVVCLLLRQEARHFCGEPSCNCYSSDGFYFVIVPNELLCRQQPPHLGMEQAKVRIRSALLDNHLPGLSLLQHVGRP